MCRCRKHVEGSPKVISGHIRLCKALRRAISLFRAIQGYNCLLFVALLMGSDRRAVGGVRVF